MKVKNTPDDIDGISYAGALLRFAGSPCLDACAHRVFNEKTEDFECPAFPDGIPDDIAAGENRHADIDRRQTGKTVYKLRAKN
jgi:hypothetical protein